MVEMLLAIIAAELGFGVLIGMGIFGMEFYSLWLRYKAIREEAGSTKIRLNPDEMEQLLSGKGLPEKLGGATKVPTAAASPTHGAYA